MPHTPNPTRFLSELLVPENEQPYVLFPIGPPAAAAARPTPRRPQRVNEARERPDVIGQFLGLVVDMNELTLKYYFHPHMNGKTSIKKVLPAIWNNNPYLHAIPWFEQYVPADEAKLNPYDTLAPVISELEKEEVVKAGTGAMRAYNEIMFGATTNTERRQQLIKLLLQYCELDTMAMVIIWKYWMDKCGL